MKKTIYRKFGKDIVERIINESDSLDKIGQGYISAHLNVNLNDYIKKNSKIKIQEINTYSTNATEARLLIGIDGQIEQEEYWKVVKLADGRYIREGINNRFFSEAKRIISKMNNKFIPAKLMNQPIEDEFIVLFNW